MKPQKHETNGVGTQSTAGKFYERGKEKPNECLT
jgi:hypothetical protein